MTGIYPGLPRARTSELITRQVGAEMLVYDRDSRKAHCLNPTAALVWAYCDGQTTVAEMARLLSAEMKTPVVDEFVWFALTQLRNSHLLQKPWPEPAKTPRISRRSLVKHLGIAAAVTVPLVTTIIAPTAVAAATCFPVSAACTANSDCCSNNCADNGRGTFNCT